jgi:hypothetical protein
MEGTRRRRSSTTSRSFAPPTASMYLRLHPAQRPLPSSIASSTTGVFANSGHARQRECGACSFMRRRREMPSKPQPARAAARSMTVSRPRPAAESSCPSGRPGPARPDIVAFESLAQEPRTSTMKDPSLRRMRSEDPGSPVSATVEGARLCDGMTDESGCSRTQSPGAIRLESTCRCHEAQQSTAYSKTGSNAPRRRL